MSVAFSHASTLVISALYNNTVRIWCANTGKFIYEHGDRSFNRIAFSHDLAPVASADDKTVRIWCVDMGVYIHELKGHSDWVRSGTFLHHSALVATADLVHEHRRVHA